MVTYGLVREEMRLLCLALSALKRFAKLRHYDSILCALILFVKIMLHKQYV